MKKAPAFFQRKAASTVAAKPITVIAATASTALIILIAAASLIPACSPAPRPAPKGWLFIIGGGERDKPLMKRYISLSAGFGTGKVVVFTMASGVPDEVGPELVAEFKGLGVADVAYYQLTREEAMKPDSPKILDGTGGVYFAGGDQSRLTAALLDTPVHDRMRELYRTGCVIGGTSAGAAVMSDVMVTGDEKSTTDEDELWRVIRADDVVTTRGFGFVKDAVIDQHFITRRRNNRLISVVVEHPELLGVGIDESTAVLVRPDGRYEILGENQVIIYDARRAATFVSPSGRLGVHGMAMNILLPGDVYDPGRGRVEPR